MAEDKPTNKPYGYVYLVRNMVNGKSYIGQSIHPVNKRWKQHVSASRTSKKMQLNSAIQKYGAEAFQVFELGSTSSLDELDALERSHIGRFNSRDDEVGYNVREGGGNGSMAPSSREKISKSLIGNKRSLGKPAHNKGKPMSEAQRLKVVAQMKNSHPCKGRVVSEETRAKIAAKNKITKLGQKRSEESKVKQSSTSRAKFAQLSAAEKRERNAHLETIHKGNIGKPRSEETRRKISEKLKGQVRSEEMRQRISATMLRYRASQREKK